MSLLVWHCSDPNIVLYKNNTHLEMMSCAKLQTKTDSLECAKFTHIRFVFHNLMFLNYTVNDAKALLKMEINSLLLIAEFS